MNPELDWTLCWFKKRLNLLSNSSKFTAIGSFVKNCKVVPYLKFKNVYEQKYKQLYNAFIWYIGKTFLVLKYYWLVINYITSSVRK